MSIYSVDLNKIVVSNKLKINDTTYKYICGYLDNDTIQPLCVILPQINDGEKKIYEKYHKIWRVIRNLLKMDFTINPIQDDIYSIANFKIFDRINGTVYNNILIPIINIDSILKIYNSISPRAYSKYFKYKLKNYINDEFIDEDSDSDIDDAIDSHLNFSVPYSYV